MAEQWVTVSAREGLHARTAARIARAARSTAVRLTIEHEGRHADATSLTALLALGVEGGSRVRLKAEGDGAEAVLAQVALLLRRGAGSGTYYGSGVSPGVGVGRAALVAGAAPEADQAMRAEPSGDSEAEARRLHDAVRDARAQLASLEVWARREIGGASDILRAERELLSDIAWRESVEGRIRGGGMTAEAAVRLAIRNAGVLPAGAEGGSGDGLREVLRDVGTRLVRCLAHQAPDVSEAGGGPIVLVAWQVSPSELLEWPRERLAGIVAAVGSAQAHAALVARALRVPMVVGVGEGPVAAAGAGAHRYAGTTVMVDGTRGVVVIEPEKATIAHRPEGAKRPAAAPRPPAAGRPHILANADTPDEVQSALAAGAEGIGLVRTERLFLGREVPPTEEEQYRALRAVAVAGEGRPLALRLADLGGDKVPPYLVALLGSESPRWRGAGLLARYAVLAWPHLRALARVAREHDVTIMVPMVATRDEWQAIQALWRKAAGSAGAMARLSLMVETPAATLDLERLLPGVDEVAIGTNDLTALLYGADRKRGATVRAPALQPVTLRCVAKAIECAHANGVPVTACGEAAGSLPEAPVLWGLGVDALSVAPGRIAALSRAMGAFDEGEVRALARDTIEMDDVAQVLARLKGWRRELMTRAGASDATAVHAAITDWPEGWEEHDI